VELLLDKGADIHHEDNVSDGPVILRRRMWIDFDYMPML